MKEIMIDITKYKVEIYTSSFFDLGFSIETINIYNKNNYPILTLVTILRYNTNKTNYSKNVNVYYKKKIVYRSRFKGHILRFFIKKFFPKTILRRKLKILLKVLKIPKINYDKL